MNLPFILYSVGTFFWISVIMNMYLHWRSYVSGHLCGIILKNVANLLNRFEKCCYFKLRAVGSIVSVPNITFSANTAGVLILMNNSVYLQDAFWMATAHVLLQTTDAFKELCVCLNVLPTLIHNLLKYFDIGNGSCTSHIRRCDV